MTLLAVSKLVHVAFVKEPQGPVLGAVDHLVGVYPTLDEAETTLRTLDAHIHCLPLGYALPPSTARSALKPTVREACQLSAEM